MKLFYSLRGTLVVFAALCFFTANARAQATRTWVSGTGDDVNPCSRTAPCKTFAGAISKTAAGGEINALDPGGYGTVTITKALTIDGAGTLASILNAGGVAGINVNVTDTSAGSTVTLRNLSIQGAVGSAAGGGTTGINIIQAGNVNVIDCVILNQSGQGIDATTTTNTSVAVRNTVIKHCLTNGILANSAAGVLARVLLEHVSILECGNGANLGANARLSARDSEFNYNSGNGILTNSPTGGLFAVARIWRSVVSFNGANGIQSGSGAGSSIVELAQTQVNNNASNGVLVSANGTVQTFSNNSIKGNGASDGCPGCTPVGPGD